MCQFFSYFFSFFFSFICPNFCLDCPLRVFSLTDFYFFYYIYVNASSKWIFLKSGQIRSNCPNMKNLFDNFYHWINLYRWIGSKKAQRVLSKTYAFNMLNNSTWIFYFLCQALRLCQKPSFSIILSRKFNDLINMIYYAIIFFHSATPLRIRGIL